MPFITLSSSWSTRKFAGLQRYDLFGSPPCQILYALAVPPWRRYICNHVLAYNRCRRMKKTIGA